MKKTRTRRQLRNQHRRFTYGHVKRSQYAIQVTQWHWFTRAQVNACFRTLRKNNKRGADLIRIKQTFARTITRKSLGIRMGKGKAPLQGYVSESRAGVSLFEIRRGGTFSKKQLAFALKKLPARSVRIRCIKPRWRILNYI